MHYLLCKTKVKDYQAFRKVFDSHAAAHRESGLTTLHVFRDADDPNLVMVFQKADDPEKALAFTQAPSAEKGAEDAGVTGSAEVLLLRRCE